MAKVEDLSDQVQRIVFSGAVDAGTRTELETAMTVFFAHLRQAGLPLPSTEPIVEVVDKGRATPMHYNARTGKILVARKLAGDLGRSCGLTATTCQLGRRPALRAVESPAAGGQVRAGGLPFMQLPQGPEVARATTRSTGRERQRRPAALPGDT